MLGDIAATSALDMSLQAQIVDLLCDLQKRRGLAYLFISHDLTVVRALASEIIVMRDGKVAESGPALELLAKPRSAYTRALFAAAFDMGRGRRGFGPMSQNPRAVLDAAGGVEDEFSRGPQQVSYWDLCDGISIPCASALDCGWVTIIRIYGTELLTLDSPNM